MEKYSRAGQATYDSMARALGMLGNYGCTNTNSEYVTLIAFPLQQCLHGRASLLRYTYIVVFFILAADS